MKLAALKALIEKLASAGLTTSTEKLIGVVFAVLDESEVQQCEIIETLNLDKPHCRGILNNFVGAKLIDSFGRRDVFYRPTAALTDALPTPQGGLALVVPHMFHEESAPGPNVCQPHAKSCILCMPFHTVSTPGGSTRFGRST